jgi:hypothetical protein
MFIGHSCFMPAASVWLYKLNYKQLKIIQGGLTVSLPLPLTRMSCKEFAHAHGLPLFCDSSMLGCGCMAAKRVGGIVRQ